MTHALILGLGILVVVCILGFTIWNSALALRTPVKKWKGWS